MLSASTSATIENGKGIPVASGPLLLLASSSGCCLRLFFYCGNKQHRRPYVARVLRCLAAHLCLALRLCFQRGHRKFWLFIACLSSHLLYPYQSDSTLNIHKRMLAGT